jgi:5'-3' exoribonuclease 1
VKNRAGITYYPSFKAANALGLSAQALSRITSSFMVLTSDNQKVNLGLSLKFEAKALKVIGYSRKNDRYWEFSQKTIDIIKEYRVWSSSLID